MRSTILIAEDEPLIRWSLAETFREDYEVLEAGSVAEAIALLHDGAPDILITDLRMPGASGVRLVEHVRARRPEAPVFVITAHGPDDEIRRCYMLEVTGILRKPFDMRTIRALVQQHAPARP